MSIVKKLIYKKGKIISTYKTRLFTSEAIDLFQKLLQEETWELVYPDHNINNSFNQFLSIYLNIFESSFPIVYHNKHNDNAWITSGIRMSCKRKRSLFLLSQNCNDSKLQLYYKHYCLILKKLLRKQNVNITIN